MMAKVYLVGAGPGGLDLLTLKAASLIAKADVILFDALVTEDILALAPLARKVAVGKRAGQPSTDQAFINRLLVASARDNSIVVRLKGGDPMIFGRAHEEILACQNAGIDIEIVPGITSASAAAAQIGASLTRRDQSRSIAFVTPSKAKNSEDDDSWADAIVKNQSTAIYMGSKEVGRLGRVISGRGIPQSTPIVLVQNVGRANASHLAGTLGTLHELVLACGDGPIIMLLGKAFAGVVTRVRASEQPPTRAAMTA